MDKNSDITIIPKILFFWYITVFLSTEILSSLNLITRLSIILVNILFFVFNLIIFKQKIIILLKNLFKRKNIFVYIIIGILGLTFLQGFFSAPNTTDSMVRRLPIVMYWVQDHTLYQDTIRNGHDFMGPFSEYIFLHLYLIFNGDRMLFFSQWVAFATTIILSFIVAKKLSNSNIIAFYGCLIVAVIPVAVLEASSVQMDMVVSLMVLSSVHFALILKEKSNLLNLSLLSFAIGLGILTKATYLIYLLIPIGILLPTMIKKWKSLFFSIMFSIMIFGIIQVRFVEQNLRLYGSISGEQGKSFYINEIITPKVIFSNLIKNSIFQLPFPVGRGIVEQIVNNIHKKMNIPLNDPRTTFFDVKFSVNPVIFPQEDIAGNPLHLFLIFLAGCILIIKRNKLMNYYYIVYLYIASIVSFLLFAAVLRWQPFHSRLLMPFFIIGSISSVIILFRFERLRIILNSILVVSVILSFALIVLNISKPFLSYSQFYNYVKTLAPPLSSIPESFFTKDREEQYFNARYYWYKPYKEIMKEAKEQQLYGTASFKLMDEFEYPMWYFLKKNELSFKVIPYSKIDNKTIIISTSKDPYSKDGYITQCIKTEIEYGYACISVINDNILDKQI